MKKMIQSLLLVAMLVFAANNNVIAQKEDNSEQVNGFAQDGGGVNGVTTVAYAWATYYGNDQACYENYGVTWSQLNGMILFMYSLNTVAGNWFVQQSVYSVPPSL